MRIQKFTTFIILMCLMCVIPLSAENWPQFRGPHGDCSSQETDLLKSWPEKGLNVLWVVDLGIGFSGPVVHSGKVYLLDRLAREKDILCYWDLQKGREQWSQHFNAPGTFEFPGSRSYPFVDEKYIFILRPFGDLHCLDKKTQKTLWKRNIRQDFDGQQPEWGFSQAPLLYKDMVIVAPIGKEAGMVGLRKSDGRAIWESSPIEGRMSYASCTLAHMGGIDQVMIVTTSRLVGLGANDGTLLKSLSGKKVNFDFTETKVICK